MALAVIVLVALAYFGLCVYVIARREHPSRAEQLLTAYAGASAMFQVALAFENAQIKVFSLGPGLWLALAGLGGLCILGALTFTYLKLNWGPIWLIAILPAAGITFAIDAYDRSSGLTELTWVEALTQSFSPATWVATLAWALIGISLVGVTFYAHSKARLPLHANRILLWLLVLPLVIIGEGLAIWGSGTTENIGQFMRLAGVAAFTYAVLADEVVDVRGLLRSGLGNGLFIGVTAIVTLIAIGLSRYLADLLSLPQWQATVTILAVVLALLYQAVRSILGQVVEETVLKTSYNTAQTAANYSKRIAEILDLGELVAAADEVLTQSIEVTRSALLVLTPLDKSGAMYTRVYSGKSETPIREFQFDKNSVFIDALAGDPKPLLQYTIDVSQKFRALDAAERKWLHGLEMDAFVPIWLDGGVLSGVLAVGPRKTGDPYRARELELLAAVADQTSVALKNARLVSNLRKLNEDMQILNDNLAATNERLKELDQAKTDFITIASHELRTPLTQIGGFSEVLSMMSQVDSISSDQLTDISDSITKACERLNEVVSQMLEVSEIDIEMIQLKIGETHIDKVLRLAVEPYASAIRERGLVFSVQGVRNLPPVQADEQKLAQAFGQIVSNAVKYTPDGRRVEVQGKFLARDDNWPDAIEIVVADNGIGISGKYLDLIFEKFFRIGGTGLHSTGTTKFMGAGPGLGLTIAKGIVEAHGGRIWAESPGYDKDKYPGTQIHVILPLKPSPFTGKNAPSLISEAMSNLSTS